MAYPAASPPLSHPQQQWHFEGSEMFEDGHCVVRGAPPKSGAELALGARLCRHLERSPFTERTERSLTPVWGLLQPPDRFCESAIWLPDKRDCQVGRAPLAGGRWTSPAGARTTACEENSERNDQ